MPTPVRVQVAIQGGGAKICGLLAAAQALQEFETGDNQKIEITRVAGTSAGAIVGGLLAAGCPLGALRDRIQVAPKEKLKALFARRTKIGSIYRVLQSLPLWNEKKLREVLDAEFKKLSVHTLGDIQRKTGRALRIVATDLRNAKSVVYDNDDQPIVNAILDSCGLPFFLRVPGGNPVVDGGICENLPVEVLDGESGFGDLVALGFQRSAVTPPENPVQFGLALLDTAMNHSMHRARRRITSDLLFEIEPRFGTFDFPAAIEEGFGDYYDLTKERASKHFEKVFDRLATPATATISGTGENRIPVSTGALERVTGDPWSSGDRETMLKLGQIWNSAYAQTKVEYSLWETQVQLNSLWREGEKHFGEPDVFTTRIRFTPGEWPMQCESAAFTANPDFPFGPARDDALVERSWSVFDSTGMPLDTVSLAALDRENPQDRRIVFFFTPPVTQQNARPPFDLVIRDLGRDLFRPLLETGKDYIGFSFPRAKDLVRHVRAFVFAPANRRILLQAASGDGLAPASKIPQGRLVPAPTGFRALGMEARDVSPQGHVKFEIELDERQPQP